jgi:hypothetical protein
MKKTVVMLSLFAAVFAFAADKPKQRVAVFPSVDISGELKDEEIDDLTDKLREIATKILPPEDFTVMKPEAVSKAVGDSALFAACTEGTCIGDLAKKARAQYGARCDVLKRGDNFALKFELYSVEEDGTIDIFTEAGLIDFQDIMALVSRRIPSAFEKILPKEKPLDIGGGGPQKDIPTNVKSETKSSNVVWAVAANVVGLGLAAVGFWQNSEYEKRHEDYVSLPEGREQSEYKSAWEKAESAKTMRNAMYISGGVLFSVGVVLWVF